jgi:hypothetical protein
MKYEQPTINKFESATRLVQSDNAKESGNCWDGHGGDNAGSSAGAYELDE